MKKPHTPGDPILRQMLLDMLGPYSDELNEGYQRRARLRRDGKRALRATHNLEQYKALVFDDEGAITVDLWLDDTPIGGKTFGIPVFGDAQVKIERKSIRAADKIRSHHQQGIEILHTDAHCDDA